MKLSRTKKILAVSLITIAGTSFFIKFSPLVIFIVISAVFAINHYEEKKAH